LFLLMLSLKHPQGWKLHGIGSGKQADHLQRFIPQKHCVRIILNY
jgi:hypothetical protein